MTPTEYSEIWNRFAESYKKVLKSDLFYRSYILKSRLLYISGDTIAIFCENGFVQRFFNERYDSVSEIFTEILGKEHILRFVTEVEEAPAQIQEDNSVSVVSDSASVSEKNEIYNNLSPRYTFDSFVVGGNNIQAYTVAKQVAEHPGSIYNPVFIYGNSGLGKTHLLQAIGNEILRRNPSQRILYVPTETFTNEFIYSIQTNRTDLFKRKYRSADVLLIDDIQFISNKEGTQEEFFNTFNELTMNGKQIVISCDRKASEIKDLADRLRTRFENGVTTDISAPDYEVRYAIMLKKTESLNIDLPREIIDSIAQSDINNVREIEGILNQFLLMTSHGQEITMDSAKEALRHLNITEFKEVNTEFILNIVSRYFRVSVEDIISKSRSKQIVLARHIAMYLCREKLGYSYTKIATDFGGMDHTSVSDGCHKVTEKYCSDEDIKFYVDEIKRMIG